MHSFFDFIVHLFRFILFEEYLIQLIIISLFPPSTFLFHYNNTTKTGRPKSVFLQIEYLSSHIVDFDHIKLPVSKQKITAIPDSDILSTIRVL